MLGRDLPTTASRLVIVDFVSFNFVINERKIVLQLFLFAKTEIEKGFSLRVLQTFC